MKECIVTTNAPAPIGPYSQAVKLNNLIFVSGQTPTDPKTGEIVRDDVQKACAVIMESIKGILEEAGSSLDKIVKTTIFIKDMDNFAAVNETYAKYFKDNYPARSTVEVARLPKDVVLEIEAIAEA